MSASRTAFLARTLVRRLLPVFILALAACTPKMDWRDFYAEDGGFIVLFPKKPGQAQHELATPMGKVTMKMYSTRIDETALGAGYADFPQAVDAHALDVMRDALVKSMGGTLVSEKPITSAGQNGIPGREIVITATLGQGGKSAPGEMRARLFARDKRYYQILLVGHKGAFDANDADMFLTSFKPA